jgi:isopenicillin N synthase-like dioxygenase
MDKRRFERGLLPWENLSLDDPNVVARKFGQGPNKYPKELRDPARFRNVVDDYHSTLTSLATGTLQMLARTLDLDDNAFSEFCQDSVAVLRLLHYPPQVPDASELERGKHLGLYNGLR